MSNQITDDDNTTTNNNQIIGVHVYPPQSDIQYCKLDNWQLRQIPRFHLLW